MKWKYGQKRALARAAGVSPSYLGDVIHGRKRASAELAKTLEAACKVVGLPLTRQDWLYPEESKSDLLTR